MLRRIDESSLFGEDLGPPYDSARRAWGLPPGEAVNWVSGVLTVPADEVRAALRPERRAYLLIVTTPTECVIGGERGDVAELTGRLGGAFFSLAGVTLASKLCQAPVPMRARPVSAVWKRVSPPASSSSTFSSMSVWAPRMSWRRSIRQVWPSSGTTSKVTR